jgi:ABC-type transport system involved in multi-copper enzyme maturation permease subunit
MHSSATIALVRDTFREALARKIFWGLFGFSTVLILFFLFIMKIDVVEGAIATISLFGKETGAQDVQKLVRDVHSSIAAFLYGIGLFLAVFASAGLIPTIFEPGRIELLLSKPVARMHILLGRYLGNLLVIASNMLYLVIAIWAIFGYKTGIWTVEFIYSTFVTIFTFAVLLTIVLYVAVRSESAVLSTVVTFTVMILSLLVSQKAMLERLLTAEWARDVVRVLYNILPKVLDLGRISRDMVRGQPIENWMPVWSSALFGVAVLGAALLAFRKRDF